MNAPRTVRTAVLLALLALVFPGAGHFALGRSRTGLVLGALRLLMPLVGLFLLLDAPSPFAVSCLMELPLLVSLGSAVHTVVLERGSRRATEPLRLRLGLAAALVMLVIGALGTLAVRSSLVRILRMPTASMTPTLLAGDRVVVDLRRSSRDWRPGELVVFRSPQDRRELFAKRVVALGGDTVEIRDRVVFRNGEPVDEPYATHGTSPLPLGEPSPRDNLPGFVVPEGNLFVLGDVRENSLDSRYFGPVPETDVIGRLTAIFSSPKGGTRWERTGRPLRTTEPRAN